MPEEKQRKSMRTSELDKMINKLQSLERVDGTSEYCEAFPEGIPDEKLWADEDDVCNGKYRYEEE